MFDIIKNFGTYPKEVQVALITSSVSLLGVLIGLIWNRNIINTLINLKVNKLLEKEKLVNSEKLESFKFKLSQDLQELIENQKFENSKQFELYKHSLIKDFENSKKDFKLKSDIVNNRFEYLKLTNNQLYNIRKLCEELLKDKTVALKNELKNSIFSYKNFYSDNNSIAKLTVDVDRIVHPLKQNQLLPIYSKLIDEIENENQATFDNSEFQTIIERIKETNDFIITKLKKYDEE